jgi:hypothetical protein
MRCLLALAIVPWLAQAQLACYHRNFCGGTKGVTEDYDVCVLLYLKFSTLKT